MHTVAHELRELAKQITTFSRRCQRTEHTDAGEAWELLYALRNRLRRLARHTARPIHVHALVEGGVLQYARASIPNIAFRVADLDNLEEQDCPQTRASYRVYRRLPFGVF